MADLGEFWTAEEISASLRIPQSTIYKLAQDKVLPEFKVGKHWRFRRETILGWIKNKEDELIPSHFTLTKFPKLTRGQISSCAWVWLPTNQREAVKDTISIGSGFHPAGWHKLPSAIDRRSAVR